MRLRLCVEGVVQGVGFRPYVYRLALACDLTGWVRNDSRGVTIEVEGEDDDVERFAARLPLDAPPLARLHCVTRQNVTRQNVSPTAARAGGFTIHSSDAGPHPAHSTVLVPPDIATCDECLSEVLDKFNRRYRYPFTNCTNCGPRFTIINGVPYDRAATTMAAFTMCENCQSEYDDPTDRRFHAQPNACAECGPSTRFVNAGRVERDSLGELNIDAISAAARELLAGAIVAIKGIGGFHFSCLATDDVAVARLRELKRRPHKPFAVMVADIASASAIIKMDECTERLLSSAERPIVLAKKRDCPMLSPRIAEGLSELGVMLPYSPIHHLLIRDVGAPLVMTSGNLTGQPISHDNEDALERLGHIADFFLLHDRSIVTSTDDSVIRSVAVGGSRRGMMIRRSRGFAPSSHILPIAATFDLVSCGAELKSTYTVARGSMAWIGPHVGDLEQYEALEAFRHGIAHHERLFDVVPRIIVHDLHPEYLSTKYALARADNENIPAIAVQHHHAHHAACMAEHGRKNACVGVVFDGTGFGPDGTLWGGEIIVGDLRTFERAGHLWPVRMPGGSAAIRAPWRMACSWLSEAQMEQRGDVPPPLPRTLEPFVSVKDWKVAWQLSRSTFASPTTSSVGRLLDALAALCGICPNVSYEGQAAIEFEAIADAASTSGYDASILPSANLPILDVRPIVNGVQRDIAHGVSIAEISARAHNSIALLSAKCCKEIASERKIQTVILSGGVFQNSLLLHRMILALESAGLEVMLPLEIPPNDGGIAFGQASVAAARSAIEVQ